MADLIIKRNFAVKPETVYAFVTDQENIVKWWGPENMTIPEIKMNLSKIGPWSSIMENQQGDKYKVTGVVEKVSPPHSVEFTWGWHDDNDERGHESRVRFDVKPDNNGGTEFILTHSGLVDEESVHNHNQGWLSSLRKLESLAT